VETIECPTQGRRKLQYQFFCYFEIFGRIIILHIRAKNISSREDNSGNILQLIYTAETLLQLIYTAEIFLQLIYTANRIWDRNFVPWKEYQYFATGNFVLVNIILHIAPPKSNLKKANNTHKGNYFRMNDGSSNTLFRNLFCKKYYVYTPRKQNRNYARYNNYLHFGINSSTKRISNRNYVGYTN